MLTQLPTPLLCIKSAALTAELGAGNECDALLFV
jgi:hypothetical protein